MMLDELKAKKDQLQKQNAFYREQIDRNMVKCELLDEMIMEEVAKQKAEAEAEPVDNPTKSEDGAVGLFKFVQ